MKIEDFNWLSLEEKKLLLWKHGKHLVTYNDGKDLYDAYELFEFYVAVCYKYNQHFMVDVTTSAYPDELPHVRRIKKLC